MISSTELLVFVLLVDSAFCAIGLRCDMIPEGVTSPRYKEDLGRYKIDISGDPDSYVPGEQYTVFIRSEGSSNDQQHKFTHFILSIVNEKFEQDIESESSVIGALQLYGDSFTKFSDSCQNAVVQADSQPKTEIQVSHLRTQLMQYFSSVPMPLLDHFIPTSFMVNELVRRVPKVSEPFPNRIARLVTVNHVVQYGRMRIRS
ncbi:unnamed protein product [Phaedon cochleariae]|uniref:Reelin domain-containing protein n=1 Tax=Phaedon cochleariae TaxID=80249 RepID=A0A9N9X3E5_PHACE|nr:unnamed protein product [Phaedon cochleariae]